MSRLALLLALAALALPPSAAAAGRDRYVSVGDSYAVGYQPTGPGQGSATRNGFADQLVPLARARGYRGLRLVNFACGGATTASLLTERTCPLPAIGGASWRGRTQLGAAERYLRRNRGRVALVTVIIGGNDVTRCAAPGQDPFACTAAAAGTLSRRVGAIARRLRGAAGRRVRIVGLTYPDVLLGLHVSGRPEDQRLAELSVSAFRLLINPALRRAYEGAGARFVDVTAASGAYTPFSATTTLAPYGTVPVAVARACELSYFCELRDIHLKTAGYRLMAELVARRLPRHAGHRRSR